MKISTRSSKLLKEISVMRGTTSIIKMMNIHIGINTRIFSFLLSGTVNAIITTSNRKA